MSKPTPRSADSSAERDALTPDGVERDRAQAIAATAKPRKTYRKPTVQKRRSVNHATLVSAGGTAGTLTSGGP